MNVDVMVNGRPWKVAVEPAESARRFNVTIKGKSRVVDASWIDEDTLSLIDGGAVCEIRLHTRTSGERAAALNAASGAIGVEIGGKVYEAIVVPPEARLKSRPTDIATPAGGSSAASSVGSSAAPSAGASATSSVGLGFSQAIRAPMPGRVVRVLVAVGDHVTARQSVVVVEAMKMENELRTARDGIVKEVLVVPGAAVESGAVLVVVGQ